MNTNQISVDQFLRSIALRPGRLGWFLGAGASASSGIPTAWDMIWDFKQQLFVSQRKVPFQEVKDLTQAANRKRIQEHIASSPNMPPLDSPEEYAKLFEAAYPSPTDRREYIDRQIKLGSPSKGHIALAILQRCGFTKRVWTTNFDTVVEDAFTKMGHSTADLIVADIDRANVAQQAISNDRWPLYVKLHGDFRSEALKNTMSELSEQDATLRRLLYEHCCSHGLIIAGYSGRDNSIMDIFEQALTHDKPFPNGLFWLQRKNAELLPRVSSFLASAELKGVECGVVTIENFDETLFDLANLIPDFDMEHLEQFSRSRARWTAAPEPSANAVFPLVRFNSILIEELPKKCHLVQCDVGGYNETQDAIKRSGLDIVATKRRVGVLAFGAEADLRAAFDHHNVRGISSYDIEDRRLRYDCQERGLLLSLLSKAIASAAEMQIDPARDHSRFKPLNATSDRWNRLKEITKKPLSGKVQGADGLQWFEGLEIRLDWADDKLWLLVEPTLLFDGHTQANKNLASDHGREHTYNRYNYAANQLIDFWTDVVAGPTGKIGALEATFKLNKKSGHSWRAGA